MTNTQEGWIIVAEVGEWAKDTADLPPLPRRAYNDKQAALFEAALTTERLRRYYIKKNVFKDVDRLKIHHYCKRVDSVDGYTLIDTLRGVVYRVILEEVELHMSGGVEQPRQSSLLEEAEKPLGFLDIIARMFPRFE